MPLVMPGIMILPCGGFLHLKAQAHPCIALQGMTELANELGLIQDGAMPELQMQGACPVQDRWACCCACPGASCAALLATRQAMVCVPGLEMFTLSEAGAAG